jgi:hypothetical protein
MNYVIQNATSRRLRGHSVAGFHGAHFPRQQKHLPTVRHGCVALRGRCTRRGRGV